MTRVTTCPVCLAAPMLPPHGVCKSCHDRLKQQLVPPRAFYEQQLRTWGDCDKDPEQAKKVVESRYWGAVDRWEQVAERGISAAYVVTEIVDQAEHLPTKVEWHRRRVLFMKDCIDNLPNALFFPVTREQLNTLLQNAVDYWDGKIAEEQRLAIYQHYKALLQKRSMADWDARGLPLWAIQTEDHFDWMWYQFMDCVYECVCDDMSDMHWVMLVQKHFADVIAQWVKHR